MSHLPVIWRTLAVVLAVVGAASCAQDPEVAKREYVATGDRYFAEGKYAEAIISYRSALQHDPRFGEARYKLAEAYLKTEDFSKAIGEYVRAADLLPARNEAQIKAGNMLLLARQFEDARSRAMNVLTRDAKNVEAQILLGNALAGLKDLDGAIAEIQEAIEIDPDRSSSYVSLGVLELAKGRAGQAESAFKRAVDANPKSVPAQLALANFYWAIRQFSDAEQAMRRAYEVDPDDVLTNRVLALLFLSTDRAADAEPYLKRAAEISKDARSQFALAEYYLAMRRLDAALSILRQVSDKEGRGPATVLMAAIAFAEGRRADAHASLDELLEREPKQVSALLLKGRFLLAEAKTDEALARVQAAAAVDPRSAQAQFLLGRIHGAMNNLPQATIAFNETLKLNSRANGARLELSRLELAAGHTEESVRLAEQAVKNEPDNALAKLMLVRGLLAGREFRRADEELKELLERYPQVSDVHTQLGNLAGLKGNRQAARSAFERALELGPENVEALDGLVALDLLDKKPSVAMARVEQWVIYNPKNPDLLLLSARTYAATRDMKKTEQALRKTIEVDSASFQAYEMLGQLYVSQGRLDQALKEFEWLATRQPHAVQAQTMAGLILEAQNKPDDARQRYERALAIDPEAPVAANNLAWMYAESGQELERAMRLAQAANGRLPENAAILDTIGWIYYKMELSDLAAEAASKSIKKDPKNALYQFHAGLAYAKIGEVTKAKRALQEALALTPNFKGADEARQVLASLES